MSDLAQKEFYFETIGSKSYTNGESIIINIRKATQQENVNRDKNLSTLKEEYTSFIRFGNYRNVFEQEWQRKLTNKRLINDKRNRLEFSRNFIAEEIRLHDISLTLASSNLVNRDNEPYFIFKNGYIDIEASSFTSMRLPEEIKREIYNRVLEINPAWAGETEKFITVLINNLGLEQPKGNFADLALNPQSVFIKSKPHILSLIEEIKQFVFEDNGTIETNIELGRLGLREVIPQPENIILRLPNKRLPDRNIFLNGYIGIIEHGNFEIKVVVKRDKSYQQDCDIEDIVVMLRSAIKWWKEVGEYTEAEAEIADAETEVEQAAISGEIDRQVWESEMRDLGLDEDDY